jgi:hypothetical protein
MQKFNEELAQAGIIMAAKGLKASSLGARVRFEGVARTVTTGPFPTTNGAASIVISTTICATSIRTAPTLAMTSSRKWLRRSHLSKSCTGVGGPKRNLPISSLKTPSASTKETPGLRVTYWRLADHSTDLGVGAQKAAGFRNAVQWGIENISISSCVNASPSRVVDGGLYSGHELAAWDERQELAELDRRLAPVLPTLTQQVGGVFDPDDLRHGGKKWRP